MILRFRGLHHFSEALHITFNDGSKFEDLAKVLSQLFVVFSFNMAMLQANIICSAQYTYADQKPTWIHSSLMF